MVVDALALTRDLVRIDTINPPGDEEACAHHLASLLEAAGFTLAFHQAAPRRTNMIARRGGRADTSPLCFTGHLDTVPLGARPWRGDPLGGELADGRVYGRGTSDMKAGIAAFVAATCRLADRLPGTPGVVLVFTADEEMGAQGAQYLAGLHGALGRAGAVVVAEPTDNQPFVGHKGALWLEARTSGITAHGSMPERGVNAIYRMARAVTRLEGYAFDVVHPVLGPPTLNVGTIQGGLNINSVPDAASIRIDIRTIPELKHAVLTERLTEYLGEDVALTPLVDVEGLWTDPEHPWVRQVFDLVTPVLGARPGVRAAPYFTDGAALAVAYGGAPTVVLGPGELALAHQTDESCEVAKLEQAVELYLELTRRWCGL
jgi:succinyl-diaminopimelate desuccinylase